MAEDTNRLCSEILTKITTQGVTLDTINTQVGKLQDEIVDIKKQVGHVSLKIVEIDGKADGAHEKAGNAQQKIDDLQTDLKKLEERADSLHTQIVEARLQVPDGLVAGFAVMQSDMKRITNMGYLIGSTVVVLIIKAIVPIIGG
jgi:uncharacterized coiled-coil DUF342 family protein